MSESPDLRIPAWVPEEHRHTLNGSSAHRTSFRMRWVKPGDGVVGVVVANRRAAPSVVHADGVPVSALKIIAGQCNGEPLTPCEWTEVYWSPRDLATFHERYDPQVGDTISVVYGGDVGRAIGAARKSFAVGITRAGVEAEGDSW